MTGSNKRDTFEHVIAIPESSVLGLVVAISCSGIFIHRFFKFRQVNALSAQSVPAAAEAHSVDKAA